MYSQIVKPLAAIKTSPSLHIKGFKIPLRKVISLSDVLPGNTCEIKLKPPPGIIPTRTLTVVRLL